MERDGHDSGMRRATLRSIAAETGLSLATVSRALNASSAVRPATIRIVNEAAEKLGYRRSAVAANLRTGKTGLFSLVMPIERPGDVLGDVGALQLMAGACSRLAETDHTLNLVPFAINASSDTAVAEVIHQGLSDGLILTLTEARDARVALLQARGIPFVTFGRTELPEPHAFYDVDNEDFGYRAARLLLARGCRRPMLVDQPGPALFSRHRRAGFGRALVEDGLPPGDRVVRQNDIAAVRRLVRGESPPDGFVCDSEISALAIMTALQDEGLKIGIDVHLTTLETSGLPALFSPPMTGFFQDLNRAGWICADLLLKRLDGADPRTLTVVETVTLRERLPGSHHDQH